MKAVVCAAILVAVTLAAGPAGAQGRYVEPPPVVVSPDLSAPWVQQLRPAPQAVRPPQHSQPQAHAPRRHAEPRRAQRRREPARAQAATVVPRSPPQQAPAIDPKFLPQEVAYRGPQKPGTLVIDTNERFLYLVLSGGKARRYGVGVGRPGFEWAGTHRVTDKREWPDWRPPASMIERERKKGRILPTFVKGGPHNPMGARALYLGSTLYRIHGTNEPWTIGQAVSSGCIRMRNEDVIDLYQRVPVGAKVVVI